MAGSDKNWNATLLIGKIETTEGTDAAPTPAANAFRVLNFNPTFMTAQRKERAVELPFFGAKPGVLSSFTRGGTFDMEMAGSGTATGIPNWMTMMRIAGFAAATVGASSVTQAPITSGIPAMSIYDYKDDLQMIALGCKAAAGFTLTDDDFPLFNFTYLGVPPTSLADQVVPASPTYTGYVDPILASSENTTFMLDGFALPLRSWTMNSNASNALRSLIGPADRIKMADRPWSGQIVAQVPDLTAKNYFANIRPGTTMSATAVHGKTAGNIVQIDTPKLQISGDVTISNEDGSVMMTIPVSALPNLGNDEILFTSK